MNINDIVNAVKTLSDAELQELVSCLANDYVDKPESTMCAMTYAFNTSRASIASRKGDLRTQAHLFKK